MFESDRSGIPHHLNPQLIPFYDVEDPSPRLATLVQHSPSRPTRPGPAFLGGSPLRARRLRSAPRVTESPGPLEGTPQPRGPNTLDLVPLGPNPKFSTP